MGSQQCVFDYCTKSKDFHRDPEKPGQGRKGRHTCACTVSAGEKTFKTLRSLRLCGESFPDCQGKLIGLRAERGGLPADFQQSFPQFFHFIEGVVMDRANADHAAFVFDPQPFGDVDRVVVPVPNVNAVLV